MPRNRELMLALVLGGPLLAGGLLAALAASAQEGNTMAKQAAADDAGLQQATGALSRLPVIQQTLQNGLRVVMSPDRTVPTVAIALYYDVGSRDEAKSKSGFAHLFEHLMFQGSQNVDKMEHFQLIMRRGGDANGTTSHDRTNYYETLPSHELELGLWLEADRMRSLAVTQENFENQRATVIEERRQSYDNQPYMLSSLRINELAYGEYWPYAHSTIGDMEDLKKASLADVQGFYRNYYTPNNAVLGLAGDFEPQQALELVRRHFGDIPRHERPPSRPGKLPVQTEERYEVMPDPLAPLPAFHISYHIPPDREPDHYPLEMLAVVLGDGESSRLYQKLVKELELVQQIHVATDGRRGPDLFSFWAVCAEGRRGKEVREVIYQELEQIVARGVTERELQKARNRVRADFTFGLQSNLLRAQRLAEFEMYFGDARLLRQELEPYLQVSVKDIQRVAGKYLKADNRAVLDVVPGPAGQGAEGTR